MGFTGMTYLAKVSIGVVYGRVGLFVALIEEIVVRCRGFLLF